MHYSEFLARSPYRHLHHPLAAHYNAPMKNTLLLTALLVLLYPLNVFAAAERPAPKGIGNMASPVTTTRNVNGLTEGAAYLATLKPDMRAALEKEGQVLFGEQKEGSGGSYGGYIRAVAFFKQPKARAFSLIIEPSLQPLYLPRLVSATAVEQPTNGELDEFTLKVLIAKFVFRTRHWFYPEHSRVEWSLEKNWKNDIDAQDGYWQLYAVTPELTVGEYGTMIDTGIAVPGWVQDMLARKDIPKALTAFRKYINSDGKFRRDD